MKRKIKKYLMLFTMVAGMLLSATIPVFAYARETEQQTTEAENTNAGTEISATGAVDGNAAETPLAEEPSDTEETSAEEEMSARVSGTSFSVPGNGQLVDDLQEDESKQFLTVQTKNGNTFFMVLDRSNNTENVYMLSMIDEDDLAEFINDTKKETGQEQPAVIIPETENPSISAEQEIEREQEKQEGSVHTGALPVIFLLFAGGIGIFYYFKVWKQKRDEDESEDEDLEFYDDGVYINEEQKDSTDDGAE